MTVGSGKRVKSRVAEKRGERADVAAKNQEVVRQFTWAISDTLSATVE
jgi:hypothetical protein